MHLYLFMLHLSSLIQLIVHYNALSSLNITSLDNDSELNVNGPEVCACCRESRWRATPPRTETQ